MTNLDRVALTLGELGLGSKQRPRAPQRVVGQRPVGAVVAPGLR
jgi:hypothetical protein